MNNDQPAPVRKLWCGDCGSIQDYTRRDGNWFYSKCGRMLA